MHDPSVRTLTAPEGWQPETLLQLAARTGQLPDTRALVANLTGCFVGMLHHDGYVDAAYTLHVRSTEWAEASR